MARAPSNNYIAMPKTLFNKSILVCKSQYYQCRSIPLFTNFELIEPFNNIVPICTVFWRKIFVLKKIYI